MNAVGRALAPLIAVNFLSSVGFSVVMPFLVFLVTGLGGNAFVMGVIGATFSVSQLIGAPWLGGMSDRVGRKRVLLYSQLGGMLAWAVFLIALVAPRSALFAIDTRITGSFVLTLPVLLIAISRATDGLINGSISVANAYLADVTTEAERKASFARLGAASSLGFVIGPFAAGYIARDDRGVMLLVSAALLLSGIGALVVWRYLPAISTGAITSADAARAAASHKVLGGGSKECVGRRHPRSPLRALLDLPHAKRMISLYFLVFLGFSIFVTVLPMHAVVELRWSSDRLGSLFGVLSVALIITQTAILPRLARRSSDAALGGWGSVLVSGAYVVVSLGGSPGAFVAAALYGVGNGLMWPSYLAMLSATGSPSTRGRLQGVASSAGSIASIAGMLGGGTAFGMIGSATFLVAAASLALAAILFAFGAAEPRVEPEGGVPAGA
jgi:MFS family permease